MMDYALHEEENLFSSVPISIAGAILYLAGVGEVPVKWTGVILRDFSRFVKLEPFREEKKEDSSY